MMNILGLGKKAKPVKVTIEYCPKSVTLPYKVKKLINQSSLLVPTDTNDPMGFMDKEIRVGEYMNEKQLKHLVQVARDGKDDLNTVEIVEATTTEELLHD